MQHLIAWPSIRLLKRTNFAETSRKIVNQTPENISGGKDLLQTTQKEHQGNKTISLEKPNNFLQYTSKLTENLANKLKKRCDFASGFYNAKNKIMPPHFEKIVR